MDWYVVKATEVESYSVPENVKTYRADLRTAANEMQAKVDACTIIDELVALYEYSGDPLTRPLGEFPTKPENIQAYREGFIFAEPL